MLADKVKNICLIFSVVLATILFICLYLVNNSKDISVVGSDIENNTNLYEYKGIYENYNPGDMSNMYINIFSTRDGEGNVYDFSAFDLMSDWNKDFNPVLDANVQVYSNNKQAGGRPINMPNSSISVRGNPKASLKSYRLKYMDGIDGFHGQSVINLNKHLNDPSRIANKLAHDLIINLKDISGLRTSFLQVYIKDGSLEEGENEFNSYGLYTHTEQPNKSYLRSRGLDVNGSLYRAKDFKFQPTPQLKNVDDSNYDRELFETVLDIREGKDHTKLLQMLEDINDEKKNFGEVFHKYFNEENYLTWLSINILLGNRDAMSDGFLLYNPSDSSVFYFLPWSFDGIFQWMEDESDTPNIYDRMAEVDLHRKYMEQDENIEKLKGKIEELISDAFAPGKVKSLIKQYKPVLLEVMNQYPDNVLSSIPLIEHIAYLGQIDEMILINYDEFMGRYE